MNKELTKRDIQQHRFELRGMFTMSLATYLDDVKTEMEMLRRFGKTFSDETTRKNTDVVFEIL